MHTAVPLQIAIVAGVGRGSTLLSSFDQALHACGVCNYNLIALSSVIPPQAQVLPCAHYATPAAEYGHRLYVVKADMRSDHAGKVIGAGIGWVQWDDGRGVFVEHETIGSTREVVDAELAYRITHSLQDLCVARGIPVEEDAMQSTTAVAEVEHQPTTVLVLAVYQAEPWR